MSDKRDNLDRLLEMGGTFDWISPAWALAQDIFNGPGYTFVFDDDCAYTPQEIGGLLRANGIKAWGATIIRDTYQITVRQDDVEEAQAVLERAGILPPSGHPPVFLRARVGLSKPAAPGKPRGRSRIWGLLERNK